MPWRHQFRMAPSEIFAPGRLGFELRESLVTRWARRLYRGAPSSDYCELAAEASVAASWSMARAEAAAGRAERLARLAPMMAFVVLAPAIGPEAAERAITAELLPARTGLEVRRHLPQPA